MTVLGGVNWRKNILLADFCCKFSGVFLEGVEVAASSFGQQGAVVRD